jgi:group I intron endonuclease
MHIYEILNTITCEIYIGQHSKDDLDRYLRQNITTALSGRKGKTKLYNAIRKYGGESFEIRSLYTPSNKEDMDKAEISLIRFYRSNEKGFGYNLTEGGGGMLGKPCSPETRAKISAAQVGRKHTQETLEKMSNTHTGRIFTAEHRAKIGFANTLRIVSDSTRKKLSDYRKSVGVSAAMHESARVANTGRIQSGATRLLQSQARAAWWALRKQEVDQCQTRKTA